MKRIYLDSNILIAHFSVDRAEEAKKELVENALDVFAQLKDVQLCTSIWAITEMVNILVSHKRMNRGDVAEIESQLVSERRLKDLKIVFAEVSPQRDYDFTEFFWHVRQGILKRNGTLSLFLCQVQKRTIPFSNIIRAWATSFIAS